MTILQRRGAWALVIALATGLAAVRVSRAQLSAEADVLVFARQDVRGTPLLTNLPDSVELTVQAVDTWVYEEIVGQVRVDAGVSGDGKARFGILSGSVRSEGTTLPNDRTNNHRAIARGRIVLKFIDRVTVVSDTLPAGSPVEVTFHAVLDSSILLTGTTAGSNGSASAEYFVRVLGVTDVRIAGEQFLANNAASTARPHIEATFRVSTAVGHVLELSGELALSADATPLPSDSLIFGVVAEAVAENTAAFTYEAAGGVRLVSDSGHEYAAAGSGADVPAPEPGPGADSPDDQMTECGACGAGMPATVTLTATGWLAARRVRRGRRE